MKDGTLYKNDEVFLHNIIGMHTFCADMLFVKTTRVAVIDHIDGRPPIMLRFDKIYTFGDRSRAILRYDDKFYYAESRTLNPYFKSLAKSDKIDPNFMMNCTGGDPRYMTRSFCMRNDIMRYIIFAIIQNVIRPLVVVNCDIIYFDNFKVYAYKHTSLTYVHRTDGYYTEIFGNSLKYSTLRNIGFITQKYGFKWPKYTMTPFMIERGYKMLFASIRNADVTFLYQ